jgi:hypothetical protein
MGQIIGSAAKPKRCNANQLSQVPTPAAGEYILVSSNNSMNAAGQGNFDCYIEGDGHTAAAALPRKSISPNDTVFVGTFNTMDELLAVQNPPKNAYGFVIAPDEGDNYYHRYKFNGTQWLFEYKISPTPFTDAQWDAIQSGINPNMVRNLILYELQNERSDIERNIALSNVSNQSADTATGKSGRKILESTKTFVSQVTSEHYLYDAISVFDLGNTAFETPSNIELDFHGNTFKISRLTIKDNVTIKNCHFVTTTLSSFSSPSIVIDGNNVKFENCTFTSLIDNVYYLFIKENTSATNIIGCTFNSNPNVDIYVCGKDTVIENCVFNDSAGTYSNAIKLSAENSSDTTSLCSRNTIIRGCAFGSFVDNAIDCFSGANGLTIEDCYFAQNVNPCIEIKNIYITDVSTGVSVKDVRMCKNIKINNCVFDSTNLSVVVSWVKDNDYDGEVENIRNVYISNCKTKNNTFIGNAIEGVDNLVIDNLKYIGEESLLNLSLYGSVRVTNVYDDRIRILCYGIGNIVEDSTVSSIIVTANCRDAVIQRCDTLKSWPLVEISSTNTTIVRECKKTSGSYLMAVHNIGNGVLIAYGNYCLNFCNAGFSDSSGKVMFFNNFYSNAGIAGIEHLTPLLLENFKIGVSYRKSGTTTQRPALTTGDAGFQYFDTTLGKPIYWNGTAWVDATGTAA